MGRGRNLEEGEEGLHPPKSAEGIGRTAKLILSRVGLVFHEVLFFSLALLAFWWPLIRVPSAY